MKKILIALLSLAMLFSFAACDNSNDTPVDPDQSGDDVTISDAQIDQVAKAITALIEGTKDSKVAIDAIITGNLLDSNGAVLDADNTEIASDWTSISKTVNLNDGIDGYSYDTVVTLTLEGVDITPNATATQNKVIRLQNYTYEFSTNDTDSNMNNVELKGTISGYVVGDGSTSGIVTVTRPAGTVTQISVTKPSSILLPESASEVNVTLGGETVDATKLLALLNDNVPTPSPKATTYKSYMDAQELEAQKLMNSYVEDVILAGTGSNSLFTRLGEFIALSSGTTKSYADGSANSKATASISYTVPASANYILADASKSVKINQITMTFTAAANGVTSGSFTPATFEISGTFAVYGDATATKLSEDFEELVITSVKGKVGGTTPSITADGGVFDEFTGTGVTFTIETNDKSVTTGTVTADVLTAAGPALSGTGADTDLAPLGEVTLTYPEKDSLEIV